MVTRKQQYVDISDSPAVLKLVEEVSADGKPKVLRSNGKDVATITPLASKGALPKPKTRARGKTGILTKDDPLFRLIGKWSSNEPTDASKKHELLAESYSRLHR